jgi:hypothetical protein
MERFSNILSCEDFDIICAALRKSMPNGTADEIREQVIHALSALLLDAEIDEAIIEALVASVQSRPRPALANPIARLSTDSA